MKILTLLAAMMALCFSSQALAHMAGANSHSFDSKTLTLLKDKSAVDTILDRGCILPWRNISKS